MGTIIMASRITCALGCNPFHESVHNMLSWMTEKLPQLNSDHKVHDRCFKKIPELKCDASDK
jgi:hypothetical protein